MLYISPSLVISEPDYTSLTYPAFLWDNTFGVGDVTADYEDADYPATNLANPQTSSLWKSSGTADQNLLFAVASDEEIDCVGIARHNFGSTGVLVTIKGTTAGAGGVFTTLAELSPGDDAPIMAFFDADFYTEIKLFLEPAATAPQAAVVYIGTALKIPRSPPPGFTLLKDGLNRQTQVNIAENGDFLGDIVVSERLDTTVDFKLLEGDWYRSDMRPFVQSSEPFFFAVSPTTLPDEVGFCKFGSVPRGVVNQFTGQTDVSIPLVGLAL